MGHESQIELWTPLERRSALLVSELTGFVVKQAMKTAGRGNPNRWTLVSSNRAHGAVGQKPSCSFTGAAKQEKFQPLEACFFLTSPFIELARYLSGKPTNHPSGLDSQKRSKINILKTSAVSE